MCTVSHESIDGIVQTSTDTSLGLGGVGVSNNLLMDTFYIKQKFPLISKC